MKYAVDPNSIQAYRMTVYMLSQELRQETNPSFRVMTAMYLAEAATTLARMEMLEAKNAEVTKQVESKLG